MKRFSSFGYNFAIAGEAIIQNKLRSMLTSLGIICGVASVIAMLAIGKGAEQEILDKMKILGANNIIIKTLDNKQQKAKTEEAENSAADSKTSAQSKNKSEKKKFSPGLTMHDAAAIRSIVPDIKNVAEEIILDLPAIHGSSKNNVQLAGVNLDFFDVNSYSMYSGSLFNSTHVDKSLPVCVLGWRVKTKLFPMEDAIGKPIKIGSQWLTVIGVIGEKRLSKDNIKNLGIRDYNMDVYVPVSTMLLRFVNRDLITKKDLKRGRGDDEESSSSKSGDAANNNQIDRVVVKLKSSDNIIKISEVISRMLLRRHNEVKDFEVVVPEALLEQEQSAKRIFNIVLGAIASISLLVGGIGIMNIMLASVLERTKEIGIRRAIGAKEDDVMLQFLLEAVAISLTGGLIGIFLGVAVSYIIEMSTDIKTIVAPMSVFISFFVSISVGLIFGIAPAKKAAKQIVIDLLRYE